MDEQRQVQRFAKMAREAIGAFDGTDLYEGGRLNFVDCFDDGSFRIEINLHPTGYITLWWDRYPFEYGPLCIRSTPA